MKPLKYVNLKQFEKSLLWSRLFISKVCTIGIAMMPLLLSTNSPTAAQSRPGDPGFFEEGGDLLDREIQRQNQLPNPEEDLLRIEDTSSGWMQVTSAEGGFVVLMPGTPIQQPQPDILATESANLSTLKMTLQTDEVSFIVAYADYPRSIDLDAPQALLTQIGSALATKLGNPLREEREIVWDDYPGREISFQSPSEISTFRLYLLDRRLYILGVQQSSLNPTSDNITRFFDSFQVILPE